MATQALVTRQDLFRLGLPGDALTGLPNEFIDSILLAASGIAISYLRKRYMPPYVSVGEDVKRAVVNIAQFEILSRRGFRPGSGNDDISVIRYDQAIAWLKMAASGDVECDIVDSTPPDDEQGPLSCSAPLTSFSMTTTRRGGGSCCDD